MPKTDQQIILKTPKRIRTLNDRKGRPRPDRSTCLRVRLGLMASVTGVSLAVLVVIFGLADMASALGMARTARTLTVNDEGHLYLVAESGAYLIEEGQVKGSLPGRVRASFDLETALTASFTLYPRGGGSITGRGSGKLNSVGRYSSFGGTMRISHGTGRFVHASGQSGLYGTILRENAFPVLVQTRGTLHY